MTRRILFVDDDAETRTMLRTRLGRRGYEVETADSGHEALEYIAKNEFDVVVTDLNMRGIGGIELCQRIVESRPDVPVIVLTAYGSLDTAIAAIRAGAYDFITKPFELEVLTIAIDRALAHRSMRLEVRRLTRVVEQSKEFSDIIGESDAMKAVFNTIDRIAAAEASVLITGESGSGKELVARAIHSRSPRSSGPFVGVNCTALPETLLESELFGHAKGAFTDARAARAGLFQQATDGTLLLDEIGDMPLGLQPKLLRVLQERSVRPVGGDQEVSVDVRLVSTTNCDLETAVQERRFREDLFYRLNVIHIHIPPLRARGMDILLLAQHFCTRFADRSGKAVTGISAEAAQKLLAYEWPGNVRELQNVIERAIALTTYGEVCVEDLPEKLQNLRPKQVLLAADDPNELGPLEEIERRYILRVYEAVGGNKTLAAQILAVDRKTLYRKLEQYGMLKSAARTAQHSTPAPINRI